MTDGRLTLHCSADLAARLGALPAERYRPELSFPCWKYPDGSIHVHATTKCGRVVGMHWPLIGEPQGQRTE